MRQDISFVSSEQTLAGHLYQPEKGHRPFPLVILCHGFCGVKELLIPAYAEFFAKNGYAALTFDYRGFGKSEGESGRLVPKLQIEDIRAAIDYSHQLDVIDSDRIALWGTSFGGANAIVAAAQDQRVKCLLVQLTFADGERVITHGMSDEEQARFQQTIKRMQEKKAATGREMMVPVSKVLTDEQSLVFYKANREQFPALGIKIPFLTVAETMQHKPEQSIKDISAPILIVAAEKDSVNPPEESQCLYQQACEPKKLHTEMGATHYDLYTGKHFERISKLQLRWLKEYC